MPQLERLPKLPFIKLRSKHRNMLTGMNSRLIWRAFMAFHRLSQHSVSRYASRASVASFICSMQLRA